MLHGCSGMWTRSGRPLPSYEFWAEHFRNLGYATYHAFDRSSGHLRYRPDVRNPSSATGWGAHVGPHPQARRKALERATAFLERHR